MTKKILEPAPQRLIGSDGTIPYGNFAGPIAVMNVNDFDYMAMDRRPWTLWRASAGKLLKRWQFVGAIDENIIFGAAVAHVQYLATGFAYVFERKTGQITEKNIKSPLALGTHFSASPALGNSEIKQGQRSIRLNNTIYKNSREVEIDFGPALKARLLYREPGVGVTTTCPQAHKGFHYTYKSAGLPAEGTVQVNGRTYQLTGKALALLDWTASTPPRQTTWNWSCGVGHDQAGRTLGLNFSNGLVGGPYSQNAIWVDGAPHMLGVVKFDYDSNNILGRPWRLTTADGGLELTFQPDQERYENINLGLVASSLHQPFGTFEGRFKAGRNWMDLKLFGFCEEHYAKW